MTTVVLGWDGLDYDLVHEFGLADAFGAHVSEIETIVNDELGKPHTWELWPSIITGQPPQTHGIHADEYIETNWSHPLVRWAARLSAPIPDAIRWRVGRWLRNRGAEMAFEDTTAYADQWTIFDGRHAFPLAIPNYRSAVDDRVGMTDDRGAELAAVLETSTDDEGTTTRQPSTDPETFAARIAGGAGEKVGFVRHAIAQDYDLIFVWFSYLDTAGHVAPAIDGSDAWLREHYDLAANWTQAIHQTLDADDVLVCLSDHGLQNGHHTETACIGAWPGVVARDVDHVLGVADVLDAHTPRTRDATAGATTDADTAADVRANLEALGYVD